MKRNLNNLEQEGRKILQNNNKRDLAYDELEEYWQGVQSSDTEKKLDALLNIYYVGIALGYRTAQGK